MKEIGGYFGLEAFAGSTYYPDAVAVNNARNALLYILKLRNVKKLYIPSFLCDTVAELCKRERYSYEEYRIDKNFLPVFNKRLEEDAWIYVVNYYGQITNEQISEMQKHWGRVIVDNVQAFFQKPLPGVDTVYSCRKFFGVPDGGYAVVDKLLPEPLLLDISKDRMKHVLGRFEGCGSDYYMDFQNNDESFYELPLRKMSKLTENILRGIDYESVRNRRNANYAHLESVLGQYNLLKLTAPDGPYCYPFYCENGMEIKKRLAKEKIYVPTLWPNVLESEAGGLEKDYAANILPLPVDQRYTGEDMDRIVACLLPLLA